MTIDRKAGVQILVCDVCGEQLPNEASDEWREFWYDAKRQGWTTVKVENKYNNWIHACPTCEIPQ